MSQLSFFALGNSNAISSIDLSNSYNGVSGYNILAVGILVFISNWAGPIYWSIAGVLLLGSHGKIRRHINPEEMDTRDWIAEEREHLVKMAEKEEESAERRKDGKVWRQHVALLTLFTSAGLVAVMAACTALRTHLFVWSVFSPKYLYAMAWSVPWHLGINCAFGSLFWWFGTW